MLFTHGSQRPMGCILPTMHCRSQTCWELLHPFAHHCQHARNNSQHCWRNNVRSCCARLHAALFLVRNHVTRCPFCLTKRRKFSLQNLHKKRNRSSKWREPLFFFSTNRLPRRQLRPAISVVVHQFNQNPGPPLPWALH